MSITHINFNYHNISNIGSDIVFSEEKVQNQFLSSEGLKIFQKNNIVEVIIIFKFPAS